METHRIEQLGDNTFGP